MSEGWTERQLRQYVHLRSAFMKTGFSQDVAEAHARRTLEQRPSVQRRLSEGETKDDLYLEAKRYNITGRSKMDKAELERAVERHRAAHGGAAGDEDDALDAD